jgi:hypothetical protein
MLNLDALKNLDSLVEKNDGPFWYMRQGDINTSEPIVMRILFPKALHKSEAGTGFFFTYMKEHWFELQGRDKKMKVLSSAPYYGAASDYVEQAKTYLAANNPQAAAFFKIPNKYDCNTTFAIPCLILEDVKYATDGSGAIASYHIKNDKVCIFQCTKMTIDAISKIFTAPYRQKPSGKAIADPAEGWSLMLTKSETGQGAKKKTTYTVDCLPVAHAIDPIWEKDLDLDVWHKRQLYDDTYIASVVTHFINGRGILAEPSYRHPELREESKESEAPATGPIVSLPSFGQPVQTAQPVAAAPQVGVPTVATPTIDAPTIPTPPPVEQAQPAEVVIPAVVEMPTTAAMPVMEPFTNIGADINDLPSSVSKPGNLLDKLKANTAK